MKARDVRGLRGGEGGQRSGVERKREGGKEGRERRSYSFK